MRIQRPQTQLLNNCSRVSVHFNPNPTTAHAVCRRPSPMRLPRRGSHQHQTQALALGLVGLWGVAAGAVINEIIVWSTCALRNCSLEVSSELLCTCTLAAHSVCFRCSLVEGRALAMSI